MSRLPQRAVSDCCAPSCRFNSSGGGGYPGSGRGLFSPMSLSYPTAGHADSLWGRPDLIGEERVRGARADQGVRPTINSRLHETKVTVRLNSSAGAPRTLEGARNSFQRKRNSSTKTKVTVRLRSSVGHPH